LSSLGQGVVVVDRDVEACRTINGQHCPFSEPEVQDLLQRFPFTAGSDFATVADARVVIITIGTPLRPHLEADTTPLWNLARSIGPYLRTGDQPAFSRVAFTVQLPGQRGGRSGLLPGASGRGGDDS
jgi:UDP-glucose 6-dehydrogenase